MPATPERAAFIQEQFRRAVTETSSAKTRHGALARESEDPVETWFDSAADAQVIADARQALLSEERRRFKVTMAGAEDLFAIDLEGRIPTAEYVDAERDCDRLMLVSEIVFDLNRGNSAMMLWG